MKIIERVVQDAGEPGKHDLWLKTSANGGGSAELLVNLGGEWKPVNPLLADREFTEEEKTAMKEALGISAVQPDLTVTDPTNPAYVRGFFLIDDLSGDPVSLTDEEVIMVKRSFALRSSRSGRLYLLVPVMTDSIMSGLEDEFGAIPDRVFGDFTVNTSGGMSSGCYWALVGNSLYYFEA